MQPLIKEKKARLNIHQLCLACVYTQTFFSTTNIKFYMELKVTIFAYLPGSLNLFFSAHGGTVNIENKVHVFEMAQLYVIINKVVLNTQYSSAQIS